MFEISSKYLNCLKQPTLLENIVIVMPTTYKTTKADISRKIYKSKSTKDNQMPKYKVYYPIIIKVVFLVNTLHVQN